MDPLQDVLSLLGTTSYLSAGMVGGGSWAVSFPPPAGVKFNAVRRGRCRLSVDGVDGTIELTAGDCFLLTQPRAFRLSSDPDATAVPAEQIFAGGGVARAGTGEDVDLIGGGFTFGDRARALLLDALPPVILSRAGSPEATAVSWAVERIGDELNDRRLGAGLVVEHLAVVMLIQILRLQPVTPNGWLAGLADPVAGPALRAVHADPAHPWTVAELARVAAVSRSTMAARFREVVGQGPYEYLTGWRIELAANRLRHDRDTVAVIARDIGYGSESALSVAFKRAMGVSPAAYRRAA
ncbi:AraC family transcriptional regulator [Winogradskya consettensis]|uniref:AraC family transcriptional regulator n=1 Tax=Winogradskya consettensis TaxID=113560 RepID=A0A919T2A3_9ACTN|nr:AraC family transcriptional regulator [Actinoplanes consettensis]GIM82266.1 AraC family transcriptional regulator [Actinoplanes consettensis]